MTDLRLLPPSALVRTSEVDHPDWNYRPLLGAVQRLRFRTIVKLLAGTTYGRLLEIGYGSGVFMPELASHCDELHGIDPHPHLSEVERNLTAQGINADLTRGTAESLPYDADFFDCAVTISALEYVPDIESACREILRVLKPGGVFAVVTPGVTPLWDLALRVTTGESPSQYADRRQKLQPALRRHFDVVREIRIPRFGPPAIRLYTGLLLRKPG
ncbi:class I SAM-dependent methyltransferase [Actinocrispum sp. NPDC049592]|uniref:class I SAM-dependent methyltransferase n=1 Tax=Actinocrispum sp. NPDC049592 TaxID=3154835 RepID=UPI003422DCFF